MTRLFWVRHGPTHARSMVGWSDIPADLSDLAALARLNAFLPEGAVLISSDLSRATATADALARGRERLPHDPDLREMNFGAWEMRRHDDVAAEDPDLARAFWESPGTLAPPGGESWADLARRAGRATDRLLAGHPGRDIVVVAHFGPILTALQRARNLTATEALAHRIEPLSVTRLDRTGALWSCDLVNHRP